MGLSLEPNIHVKLTQLKAPKPHADHDPALPCRPAPESGDGMCRLIKEVEGYGRRA